MPPRGVKSAKRKRQYEHIKDSERGRGVGEGRAEEIAARTVNKQRAQAGETKSSRGRKKTGGSKKGGTAKRASATKTASRSRTTSAKMGGKSASRKSSSASSATKRAAKKR